MDKKIFIFHIRIKIEWDREETVEFFVTIFKFSFPKFDYVIYLNAITDCVGNIFIFHANAHTSIIFFHAERCLLSIFWHAKKMIKIYERLFCVFYYGTISLIAFENMCSSSLIFVFLSAPALQLARGNHHSIGILLQEGKCFEQSPLHRGLFLRS